MKRTYKEAVDLTVKWWSEKSFGIICNQNNGDTSSDGMGWLLMNYAAAKAILETQIRNIIRPYRWKNN